MSLFEGTGLDLKAEVRAVTKVEIERLFFFPRLLYSDALIDCCGTKTVVEWQLSAPIREVAVVSLQNTMRSGIWRWQIRDGQAPRTRTKFNS